MFLECFLHCGSYTLSSHWAHEIGLPGDFHSTDVGVKAREGLRLFHSRTAWMQQTRA